MTTNTIPTGRTTLNRHLLQCLTCRSIGDCNCSICKIYSWVHRHSESASVRNKPHRGHRKDIWLACDRRAPMQPLHREYHPLACAEDTFWTISNAEWCSCTGRCDRQTRSMPLYPRRPPCELVTAFRPKDRTAYYLISLQPVPKLCRVDHHRQNGQRHSLSKKGSFHTPSQR